MIMHDDDVVVLLPPALRVPPAETRLTVYRRPHIRPAAVFCFVLVFSGFGPQTRFKIQFLRV